MSPRKVGQHHGDARNALLTAALEMVGEGQASKLSLRAVARRAGLSPAAPYHHFADKAALLAAVAHDGFDQLAAVQAVHADAEPRDRLRRMSADYVRFAVGHAAHYSVMFESAPGESASEALKQAAMQSFLNLVGAVAAVVPDVPQDEVVRRAILGWSLAHGAVDVAHLVGTLDPSFDLEALAERVGEGVLAHALG